MEEWWIVQDRMPTGLLRLLLRSPYSKCLCASSLRHSTPERMPSSMLSAERPMRAHHEKQRHGPRHTWVAQVREVHPFHLSFSVLIWSKSLTSTQQSVASPFCPKNHPSCCTPLHMPVVHRNNTQINSNSAYPTRSTATSVLHQLKASCPAG